MGLAFHLSHEETRRLPSEGNSSRYSVGAYPPLSQEEKEQEVHLPELLPAAVAAAEPMLLLLESALVVEEQL